MIKVILSEIKKILRPAPLIIFAVLVLGLNFKLPGRQTRNIAVMHTENYPEQFMINDNCSVNLLMNDFLLENFGEVLTTKDIPRLQEIFDTLKEEITVAAEKDEILIKSGTRFNPKDTMFYGTAPQIEVAPGVFEYAAEPELTPEEEEYKFSCINGQMKMAGTSHPIYFLWGLNSIIHVINATGEYSVFSISLLRNLSDVIVPLSLISIALMVLIVPYCVSEARNKTYMIGYSTKIGRKSYLAKLIAVGIVAAVIMTFGAFFVNYLFGQWEVERYYNSSVDSAVLFSHYYSSNLSFPIDFSNPTDKILATPYSGMTFYQSYLFILLSVSLMGVIGTILLSYITLEIPNRISAVAVSLPFIALYAFFFNRYVEKGVNGHIDGPTDYAAVLGRYELHIVMSVFIILTIVVGVIIYLRKKKYSF